MYKGVKDFLLNSSFNFKFSESSCFFYNEYIIMNYYKKANYTTIVNAQRRAGGGGRLSFNNLNPTQKRSQCDLFLNPPVGTILKEIWQNIGGVNGVLFFTYEGTKHNGHPLWMTNNAFGAEPCGDNENSIYYDGNNWYQCEDGIVYKYTETKCLIPQSYYIDDGGVGVVGFSRFSIN